MAYINRGQVVDAAMLSAGVAPSAEEALMRKRDDPVAAAAGAFSLLALGELDRLHDWTANLHDWFRWLPDASIARAEHLALSGQHQKAVRTLLRLRVQGLPCLTV